MQEAVWVNGTATDVAPGKSVAELIQLLNRT